MYVKIQYITDATTAKAMLAAIQAKLQPGLMTAFMHGAVTPYIQSRVKSRFAGEGDDVTGRWHPLTVATENIRHSAGYPSKHPINVRTGQMRAFLTGTTGTAVSAGGMSSLEYPGGAGMSTLLMQKVATAQMGAATPPTIARPVLGFNMNDSVAITALVAGYLN